jgi:hypothetical protein
MKQGLSRTTRTTEDAKGCEFEYTRYTTSDGFYSEDASQVYIANGLGVEASTLGELKRLVAAK